MTRGMLAVVPQNLESNPEQTLTSVFADVGSVGSNVWYTEGIAGLQTMVSLTATVKGGAQVAQMIKNFLGKP